MTGRTKPVTAEDLAAVERDVEAATVSLRLVDAINVLDGAKHFWREHILWTDHLDQKAEAEARIERVNAAVMAEIRRVHERHGL